MKRVLILDRFSNYGFMNIHIKQVTAAFERMGWKTTVFNMGEDDYYEKLDALLAEHFDLLFSISYFGHVQHRGKPLSAHLNCPAVVMHLDHPSFFYDWVNDTPQNTIVTWLCDSHIEYVHREWGVNKFRAQACIPPGGNIDTAPTDTTVEQFLENRTIPVLFTGTFHGPPKRRWQDEFPAPANTLMDTIADIALASDELPVEAAMDMAMDALGYGPDHPVRGPVHKYIYILSLFVHDTRRYAALKALDKAGVNVHVYGKGFDSHIYRFKNFTYGGVGNFYETLSLIQQAKIVLNSNTNFVWGAHERVFAAQLGGAAVLTDTSRWYRNHFTDGEDILMYRWEQLEKMPEIALSALGDPERLFRIAKAGQHAAESQHRWDNRIADVLKLVEKTEAA